MRLFLFFLFIVSFFSAKAATIKWDGGGGNDLWSNALNWDGDAVPGASDDVLLDNDIVIGGYNVVLPTTPVTIRSLNISPLSGSTPINVNLPADNTITSGAFVTTGTGYTVIINAAGAFNNYASVSSGSGTNLTIADSIRINTGGYYIHKTQSGVSGWIQRLSRMPGTEDGTFSFAVPAANYTIDLGELNVLEGLNFGTLLFGTATSGNPITYSVIGAGQLVIRGGLTINDFAIVNLGMSDDIVVKKTFFLLSGGTLNFQTSTYNNIFKSEETFFSFGNLTETGTGTPQIQFNGTSFQNVIITGSFTNNIEFNVNNPGGIALGSPVTLPYTLILTKGKITTSSSALLTLAATATCPAGGSTLSFVEGPMKKIGNDNFTFPIGVGSIYAPIGITNAGGESPTDEFTAKYIRSNPQTTSPYGTTIDPTLDHINYAEYWTLIRSLGSSASKKVSLDVHPTSFCKDLNRTFVSTWNGSMWTNEGSTNGGITFVPPFYETGTITSANPILFGPVTKAFTHATDLSFDNNPLPVHLISFDAVKINERKASLRWELATYCSPASIFEIQRAERNRNFLAIGKQNGCDTSLFYNYYDNGLKNGINYYRLKMIDEDGKITYSSIKAIMNDADGLMLTSFVPSVVRNTANLTVTSSGEQRLDLIITDMLGRTIKKGGYRISAGNTNIELSLDNLAAGIYQLTGINANGKTNTIRFIKQ